MSSVDTSNLKALGAVKQYDFDGPHAHLLEKFENPMKKEAFKLPGFSIGKVLICSPEFTSLCPLTGQPDFATIVIEYQPDQWCVESKALKLYLGSFRNVGEFHESCVARMAKDLVDLLDPTWLKVGGEFTPRGGIPFWPEVEYFGRRLGGSDLEPGSGLESA